MDRIASEVITLLAVIAAILAVYSIVTLCLPMVKGDWKQKVLRWLGVGLIVGLGIFALTVVIETLERLG
ncbi:MAG: hypothetical protein ABL962_16190 [Fimbriimonadaceae bacterium]